ncbi:MAG: DUF1538 domain-containing protein [Dehalococcoidales bacterium]|nr:DUF1538 domain-containing protein [Dehalococcoidales bacterium]
MCRPDNRYSVLGGVLLTLSPFAGLLDGFKDVALPVLLLVLFFMVFQFKFLKRPFKQVSILLRGVLLAYIGLVLFLHGINVAFLPMANEIGITFGHYVDYWVLIPIGFLFGFLVTFAEPQVRVLCQQIEKASSGYVRASLMLYTLCIGVGVFAALAMARTIFAIPLLYILVPGYIIAFILLLFSDKNFVAIAFDSGSIATGPLTVALLISIATGAAAVIEGSNPLVDGFGTIGIITLAPIISIQVVSLLYRVKSPQGDNKNG